jgi:hypothetical protein
MSGWQRPHVSEPMRALTAKPYSLISDSSRSFVARSSFVRRPGRRKLPVIERVFAGKKAVLGSAPAVP